MKAIYLKEMRSYFHSLAAYIYFALFIAATGVYFSVICMSYGYTDYAQYVFSNSTILYIVIVPILTMRLFAEEKLPIIKMERESLSLEDVFLKLTGQDVEEVESEAKKASEQIEKQGHHGFSFKRKKKADSKGTEQAETAEEDK